ncbi:MAG: 5,6-dimethylbenzimidazole synthase, partial [Myxococcota bacterium]
MTPPPPPPSPPPPPPPPATRPEVAPAPSARRHAFPTADRDAVYRAIHTRRDVRAYLPDPVPPDVLARVLDAAHHAPSVGFMQPWDFVLVDAPAARRAAYDHVRGVSDAAAARYPDDRGATYRALKLQGLLDAPVSVVVTCDPTRGGPDVLGRPTIPETDTYSTCLAIQNLWLAARAEGLGVGWVSLYEPPAVRAILGIPEHVRVIAWLTLGWPVDLPDEPMLARVGWRRRLPLDALVHRDRWGARAEEAGAAEGGPVALPDTVPGPPERADAAARNAALTKPPGSLGRLEDAALRIARIQGGAYPRSDRKWLLLCAGDHGVTEAGVSAYERRVTARMVLQFAADAGAVNVFARATGTRVRVADLGVDHDFAGASAVADHKIARGTRSFLVAPAMDRDQALAARAAGRALVAGLGPCDLLALGEMGIGNSTAAAAMAGALLGLDAARVTGAGTGVGSRTLARKR